MEGPDSRGETVPCTMREFLSYFLRLGTFGFGGPIALLRALPLHRRRLVRAGDREAPFWLAESRLERRRHRVALSRPVTLREAPGRGLGPTCSRPGGRASSTPS